MVLETTVEDEEVGERRDGEVEEERGDQSDDGE